MEDNNRLKIGFLIGAIVELSDETSVIILDKCKGKKDNHDEFYVCMRRDGAIANVTCEDIETVIGFYKSPELFLRSTEGYTD